MTGWISTISLSRAWAASYYDEAPMPASAQEDTKSLIAHFFPLLKRNFWWQSFILNGCIVSVLVQDSPGAYENPSIRSRPIKR